MLEGHVILKQVVKGELARDMGVLASPWSRLMGGWC